ncbi:MAG: hypothetical protein KGL48_12265 [Sphingomonadales bacterium]|nr:hypothetical protein [Sphingomonadales bacterium]MDE2569616.1 hypothetical protein [Sphingomonadales bacterium]
MIEILLALSTGHLREQTCNTWLHEAPLATFAKGDHGWFVYVADDEPDDLPPDLRDCLTLARSLDCDWVMFDRDVEPIAELPVYTW